MKYLADENIAAKIVAWLRNRGNDVRYAVEERPGELDSQWLQEAEAEQRLILTSDKDRRRLFYDKRPFTGGLQRLGFVDFSIEDCL